MGNASQVIALLRPASVPARPTGRITHLRVTVLRARWLLMRGWQVTGVRPAGDRLCFLRYRGPARLPIPLQRGPSSLRRSFLAPTAPSAGPHRGSSGAGQSRHLPRPFSSQGCSLLASTAPSAGARHGPLPGGSTPAPPPRPLWLAGPVVRVVIGGLLARRRRQPCLVMSGT